MATLEKPTTDDKGAPPSTPPAKNADDTQQSNATPPASKGYEPGFRPNGTAFPGVDPDTGERHAVTWDGLRAEFGERKGSRLYNDLAVAAFGGVQPGRPSLSLITAIDEKHFRSPLRDQFGDVTESEQDYEKARQKYRDRAAKVKTLMASAEAEAAKEV